MPLTLLKKDAFKNEWMNGTPKLLSRWRAGLIHLALSALVAGVVFVLLVGLWFPSPHFDAGGGKHLFVLLVSVDVVLGPLLTLLVFRPDKPGLKMDLAVIGFVQVLALGYGIYMMSIVRPVFVVAAVDRFVTVSAGQLDPLDLLAAPRPQWRKLPWSGPQLVGVQRPDDSAARTELLFSALAGKDIERFPRYYTTYEEVVPALLARARALDDLRGMHPTQATLVDSFVQRQGGDEQVLVWVPLVGHDADIVMVLEQRTGQILGALKLDPWHPSDSASAAKASARPQDSAQ